MGGWWSVVTDQVARSGCVCVFVVTVGHDAWTVARGESAVFGSALPCPSYSGFSPDLKFQIFSLYVHHINF